MKVLTLYFYLFAYNYCLVKKKNSFALFSLRYLEFFLPENFIQQPSLENFKSNVNSPILLLIV